MGVNNPERAFFWDTTTNSWRKAVVGELGEFVWDTTANAWVKGTLGAEYKWDETTKSWLKGPGGKYVWNESTRVWDKVTSSGYGGQFYWDDKNRVWVKNSDAALNLCLQSQTFDNASWTKANFTVTPDAIAAPDGTLTADLLTVTSTAATNINQSVGAITGTNCCASIYVQNLNRSDTATSFVLYDVTGASNRVSVSINWAAMTVSGTGASIKRLGSTNWYRIIMVDTAWTSGNVARIYPGATGGSLTSGLAWYLWGAQVRASNSAGAYRPTTTVPA